jgi:heme o synthase
VKAAPRGGAGSTALHAWPAVAAPRRPAPAGTSRPPAAGVRHAGGPALAADLFTLAKPGITTFIALTAAAGYLLGAGGAWSGARLALLLLATALTSGGASALNQLVERDADALMRRTRSRPLPAGRLDPRAAGGYGAALIGAGLAVAAASLPPVTALLLAASAVVYVGVYTPLKKVHPLSTFAGAVPGALPILAGWTAGGRGADPVGWTLFGILFLWQLPHFLAIARLCRDDYRRAGFRVLGVTDRDGRTAGRHALCYALALVVVAPAAAVGQVLGVVFATGAVVLGVGYAACALQMVRARGDDGGARRLFLVSLVYLPALLALMALDRVLA